MKVLLLNPYSPTPQPIMPLGLAYLASAMQKENVDVRIIDAWAERLDNDRLAACLRCLPEPAFIGVSVMSPTYSQAMETIRVIKAVLPRTRIVIGGTHPSSLPMDCMRENPEIDFVAVGEGDALICQLAEALNRKENDFSRIKGLWYRKGGRIIENGRADTIDDLDRLPYPARHLFSPARYESHPPYRRYKEYATMITSRGCPYRCAYCTKSVSGHKFRAQSPWRVADEMKMLIREYGIRQIHFYDDDFTIDMRRVEQLCDILIEGRINVSWSCVTRVDLVDKRLLSKMRRAGCWLISYGVESGAQEILDSVNKKYTLDIVKNAFRDTKACGIRTLGYFIAGLPGETLDTLRRTVRLSFELNPDFVSWSQFALYPGSELYDRALNGELGDRYRRLKETVCTSDNVSSMSPFAHGHVPLYEGTLPRARIVAEIGKAYRHFYLRPIYLVGLLMKMRTFVELVSYLRLLIQYVHWRGRMSRVNKENNAARHL